MREPRSPCRSSPAAASDERTPPVLSWRTVGFKAGAPTTVRSCGRRGKETAKPAESAVVQNQQRGRLIQVEGAQHPLHNSGIGAELGKVQGDFVSHAGPRRRGFGLRATYQHHWRRQRLLRHASAIIADIGRELCRVHRSTAARG